MFEWLTACVVCPSKCLDVWRPTLLLWFHARVPILALLFLGGVGLLATLTPARSLMANAFLIFSGWQLFWTTAFCLLAASFCGASYRTIEYNGIERFLGIPLDVSQDRPDPFVRAPLLTSDNAPPVVPWQRLSNGWQIAITVIAGLSIPLTCLVHSYQHAAWRSGWILAAVAIGMGIVVAMGILMVAGWLVDRSVPQKLQIRALTGWEREHVARSLRPDGRVGKLGQSIAQWTHGPGYASRDPNSGYYVSHPGHGQMLISTFVLGVVYLLVLWFSGGAGPLREKSAYLPTVAYVVFFIMGATSVLSSLSFFFDYYRVPVTFAVALVLVVNYSLPWRPRVSFGLRSVEAPPAPAPLVEAIQARIGRVKPSTDNKKPILVVVTAPGGGIHASAWAARVLTGLTSRYDDRFVQSVGIVSGVSGGGVGIRYFVDLLARRGNQPITAKDLCTVNDLAQFSSLDAVAWGLAFPDLVHMVNPLPVSLGQVLSWMPPDRGNALERSWNHRLKTSWKDAADRPAPMMNELSALTATGAIPIVVWSATDVVTGKRVVIAPIEDAVLDRNDHAVDLYRLLRHQSDGTPLDLDVSTAARLAATFPYVTPIVGPDYGGDSKRCDPLASHLAALRLTDGGFFDNEGLVTAARWIKRILESPEARDPSKRPFNEILIVRIEPSPPPINSQVPPARTWMDSIMTSAGPLLALANVRSSSQVDRGNLEADLLADLTRMRVLPIYDDLKSNLVATIGWSPDEVESIRLGDDSFLSIRYESAVAVESNSSSPQIALKEIAIREKEVGRELGELLRGVLPLDIEERAEARSGRRVSRSGRSTEPVGPTSPSRQPAAAPPPPSAALPPSETAGRVLSEKDAQKAAQAATLEAVLLGRYEEALKMAREARQRAEQVYNDIIRVRQVKIPFRLATYPGEVSPRQPPLSWALSPLEQEFYNEAWGELERDAKAYCATKDSIKPVLVELDELFPLRQKPLE